MKNIAKLITFFGLFLVLFTNNLIAQDSEPSQASLTFTAGGQTYGPHLSASMPYFQHNGFMLGWHWSNGKKMTEALTLQTL